MKNHKNLFITIVQGRYILLLCLAIFSGFTVVGCQINPNTQSSQNTVVNNLTPTALPDRAPTATFAPTTEPIIESALTGRIYFTQSTGGIIEIDLQTGAVEQRIEVSEGAFMAGVAVSDNQEIVVAAYSEAPPEGVPQLGETGLYLANFESGELELIVPSDSQYESYSNPLISNDWLYFTHYEPLWDDSGVFIEARMTVERLPITDLNAPPETLLENAKNFSISADGSRIAYIEQDFDNLTEALISANPDGSDRQVLVEHGEFWALEGPHISPDGDQVLFAASGERQSVSALNSGLLFSMMRGPELTAKKHGPPWEIWTAPAPGGQISQLTTLATDNPWPTWSPSGEDIVVLMPGAVMLLEDPAPRFITEAFGHGEAVWVP